ncbi:MAG: type IV toxin-antitoxin system AbiEi family antitoxin domain-containing protein [Actinomycetota bacterium]
MSTAHLLSLLASRPSRVARPRDLQEAYANPAAELARLHDRGLVCRLAHGYYASVPPEWIGNAAWRPTIEAVALGIAVADYGGEAVALMGPSAARIHGALSRAIALGVVAVPKQRPRLVTRFGEIVFHKRRVESLDLERVDTPLAAGYLTTVEQTILDLTRWSGWAMAPGTIDEAIRAMAGRADWQIVSTLADRQRRRAALGRARRLASRNLPEAPDSSADTGATGGRQRGR